MNNKIAFWLIPSQEDLAYFQEIIDTLAKAYDAPTFMPHVTIYSGEYQPDQALKSFVEAIQGIQSFKLSVEQVLYTEAFTKNLFVQFQQSSILSQISETLRSCAKIPSNFTLNPHLSLIYQHLNEEIKKELITKISLPKSEVLFNEVRVISTSHKVETREDVEMWKLLFTKHLQN
ncbi:MAG: cyclic phosphodiesterase-like protein [Coleofasciculaceae cyanobacterium]